MCAQKSPFNRGFSVSDLKKRRLIRPQIYICNSFFSRQKASARRASRKKRAVFGTAIYVLFFTTESILRRKNAQKDPPKCYSSLPFTEYWLTLAQKSSPRPIRRLNGGYFTGKPLKWLPLSGAAPFPKVSCFRLSCIVALMRGRSSTKWPNGQYLSRARPTSASRTAY